VTRILNRISYGCGLFLFALLTMMTISCASLSNKDPRRELTLENSWSRSTLNKDFLGFRRLHRMAPLILDDKIIQGNAIDGIATFNRKTGSEIWRLNLRNGVEGGAQVAGDKLYFGSSDGLFYCVNVADGKVLWTFQAKAETLAAPTIDGGTVYFETGVDTVYALDAVTGKQIWFYNRQVTTSLSIRGSTKPTVTADSVYVGFSDGFIVSLKRRDGSLQWERKVGRGNRFKDVDATPVIDGTTLYVASFDGTLYALKMESGDIVWSVDQGAYVPVTLGQDRFSDRLYYSTAGSAILVLDKHTGKLLKSIPVQHGIPTQVSIYKGFIVYGESEGSLIVADQESGAVAAHFDPGHGLVARPTVLEPSGEAYFISNGANLYGMKLSLTRHADRLPWEK
jgi:outer membrane protein assembly factor BamB